MFDSIVNQYQHDLKIILHVTNDYLMLIPDTTSKKIMENIFESFREQFEKLVPSVPVLQAKKLAHLTLTHGLSTLFNLSMDQRATLIQLARICIDFDRSINWRLRLYSREEISPNEVRSIFFFLFYNRDQIKIFFFFFVVGCISSCFINERDNTPQLSFIKTE